MKGSKAMKNHNEKKTSCFFDLFMYRKIRKPIIASIGIIKSGLRNESIKAIFLKGVNPAGIKPRKR